MMMGAPKSELMVLIGSVYVGICETISQRSINTAPINTVAGINIRCEEVLKMPRAICGTAIPTKPIGPVKAVIEPARILVSTTISVRKRMIETPKPFA